VEGKFSSSKYVSSVQRVKRESPKAGQTNIYKHPQRIEPLGSRCRFARVDQTRWSDRLNAATHSARAREAPTGCAAELTRRVTPASG
jgi:hypothetical protein